MDVAVPYGAGTVAFRLPDTAQVTVATPRVPLAGVDGRKAIDEALEAPVGCAPLRRQVRPGSRVCIAISDYSRHTPSWLILPGLLGELKLAGVREEDITVVVATGLHRPTTQEELERMVGADLVRRLRIVNHDPDDAGNLVRLGVTSRGTPVVINRLYVEADVRISVGTIEPHHLAGWSGGPKNVLPGLASRESVLANHSLTFQPGVAIGRTLGNPVYEDLLEVAAHVAPLFIMNVLLNERKEVVRAFAGDVRAAHQTAIRSCSDLLTVSVAPAEVVIISPGGAPRDADFWQAEGKALTRAGVAVRPGGTVVLVAECAGGIGHEQLAAILKTRGAGEILSNFPREDFTTVKNKAYRLARLLDRARLVFLTRGVTADDMPGFPVTFVSTADEALACAFGERGAARASVLVVPRAPSVVLQVAESEGGEGATNSR